MTTPTLAQQLQAAIVAASQSPTGAAPVMPPILGAPAAPTNTTAAAPPMMPTTPSAPTPVQPPQGQQAPQMLGVQATTPPPMLQSAGTYTDPNVQPAPPTFTWGADPSGLGGAAANLGGYMGF